MDNSFQFFKEEPPEYNNDEFINKLKKIVRELRIGDC